MPKRFGWTALLLSGVCGFCSGGAAQAAGLLSEPIAVQDTAFCQQTSCQPAGRQPIAGSLWEFVYRTAPPAAQQQPANIGGPLLRVYTSQGRVTAGSLSLSVEAGEQAGGQAKAEATEEIAAPNLLRREDYAQAGTPAHLAAEFTTLMLGQKPTPLLLSEWQAACQSGERLNFAGARLSCSRLSLGAGQGGEGGDLLVFHIGR